MALPYHVSAKRQAHSSACGFLPDFRVPDQSTTIRCPCLQSRHDQGDPEQPPPHPPTQRSLQHHQCPSRNSQNQRSPKRHASRSLMLLNQAIGKSRLILGHPNRRLTRHIKRNRRHRRQDKQHQRRMVHRDGPAPEPGHQPTRPQQHQQGRNMAQHQVKMGNGDGIHDLMVSEPHPAGQTPGRAQSIPADWTGDCPRNQMSKHRMHPKTG